MLQGVVPVAMKRVRLEAETCHLFVGYLELGRVLSRVQTRLDLQTATRFGGGDEIDDDLVTSEWLVSGCPRQFMAMCENKRCSILFHLLVPGGK